MPQAEGKTARGTTKEKIAAASHLMAMSDNILEGCRIVCIYIIIYIIMYIYNYMYIYSDHQCVQPDRC